MKLFSIILLFSGPLLASYSKPELVARYAGVDSYRAPLGLACFGSEPLSTEQGIFLGCQSEEGFQMVRWNPDFESISTSAHNFYSLPSLSQDTVSWYEFDEGGVTQLFEKKSQELSVTELKNLGPTFSLVDSFVPLNSGTYIYRLQDDRKTLMTWTKSGVMPFFIQNVAHLFPPVSSQNGQIVLKVRKEDLSEQAPDELWLWDGGWRLILSDQAAVLNSQFKSFRHQLAIDKTSVVFIGEDQIGEGLFLLEGNHLITIARAGVDLKSFDYFSPKINQGLIAFRGVDKQNRKALWAYYDHELTQILTQGNVVKTDKGLARIDYEDQDALFYGAPGVGPTGDILQQVTLVDADSPTTLLGIGLLKVKTQ